MKERGGDRRRCCGQALRPGEEPHHRGHRPDEPVPARRRGLQDRPRRHAARPGVLRRRPARARSTASSPIRRSRSKKWGEDVWATDRFGPQLRRRAAEASSGDCAWVQHMITSMAPKTGRLAVVLPQGALFRMGAEGKIRAKILEADLVEAVIGLGAQPLLRHRPRRLHPGAPRRARPPSARARSSSSTPRRCSSGAATRTRSSPSTSSSILELRTRRSRTSDGLAHVVDARRDRAATTSTSTSRSTSSPPTTSELPTLERGARRARRRRSTRRTRAEDRLQRAAAKRGLIGMSERASPSASSRRYLWGAADAAARHSSTPATTSSSSSRCCSSSASATSTTRSTQRALEESDGDDDYADLRREPPLPDPRRRALGRRPRGHRPTSAQAILQAHARDRGGEPRHALRRLRRRAVDEQGPPARRDAARPDRALLDQDALDRQRARGRARQGVRVPDQEVRRRLRPHRAGVLHEPHARPPDDADARARSPASPSTTRPAAPAACCSRPPPSCGARARSTATCGSTARSSTS